jgi:16S rRNA (guanine527-N7)-methyltransferase
MNESRLSSLLAHASSEAGISMTPEQRPAFDRYATMIRDWNTRVNLTAILDDEGIVWRHFIDSLTILPIIDNEKSRVGNRPLSLVDVGTGAGFPGIPVRIMRPDLQVHLLDSLQKRIAFLEAVISDLNLDGVRTIKARAEDAGLDPACRERFDLATARAVAALPVLAEYTLPFVRVGGLMIAMKGQKQEEIDEARPAVRLLGGRIESIDAFSLAGGEMSRTLVLIRKISPTPARYPRKAGLPERRPLA